MRFAALFVLYGLLLAACGAASSPVEQEGQGEAAEPSQGPATDPEEPTERPEPAKSETSEPNASNGEDLEAIDPALINRRVEDFDAFLPPRLIGPDGIRPIYDPRFVSATDAPLHEDELVIGIEINGEAKAYPITVLRFREMVNDELGGLPILVTW